MNRTEFIQAFLLSGEVAASQIAQLREATGAASNDAIAETVLLAALPEFSRAARRVTTASGAWASKAVTLTGWYEQSALLSVECPTAQHPKTYLDASYIELDREAGTVYLREVVDGTAYTIRYSILHEIPAMPDDDTAPTAVTIPSSQHGAYYKLAAALTFERLASRYAETTGSGFAVDAVSYQTKTGEYLKLAKEARRQFRLALGLLPDATPEVGGIAVSIDTPSWRIMPEDAPWN